MIDSKFLMQFHNIRFVFSLLHTQFINNFGRTVFYNDLLKSHLKNKNTINSEIKS